MDSKVRVDVIGPN